MPFEAPSHDSAHWRASLQLGFAVRPRRISDVTPAASYLRHRLHYGPLRVQRPLYPEGPEICHAVIVHPPGGVAGGDSLHIDIDVGDGSHAVLATPGATKWYKSNQRSASQEITLRVHHGARLDWLPQNNIVFDAARANLALTAEIAPSASAIGWETTQLGRQTTGERWREGQLHASTTIKRPNGDLLWTERALLDAADPIRDAQQGLGGWNAFGTLWAVPATDRTDRTDRTDQTDQTDSAADASAAATGDAQTVDPILMLMDALNTLLNTPSDPQLDARLDTRLDASLGAVSPAGKHDLFAGVTRLPNGVILIRAVARRMETLQTCFTQCWELLRPVIHGVPPRPLRIWTT